ncbi:MAG: lysophospholipid acyltransferase family protein [Candidatus Omnitrophota bacterium]
MDKKAIRKSIGRLFGWLGLSFISFIVRLIPYCWIYAFAKAIAFLGYNLAVKQKKIAIESLSIAFGNEKNRQELEQIARDCFTFMAKSAIELISLMENQELLRRRVEILGKNNIDEALAKGKGVVLVSAHFGNFPLLLARLSLEGYNVNGIMRPMRDNRVEKIFLKKREKFKVRTIYSQPRKECVDNTIRALRGNEMVFIPVDQNFGTAGVFVDFFGRKAATATGPVIFAQRTKAVLLPCFIVRQKDDTHKIFCEASFEIEEKGTNQETIAANIQKLTNIIEIYIRRYPAEWGWIHRRWKSRPADNSNGGGI